ncbi:MAG: winged helix-turn-helix domain-containing protein [Clostridiaceae bacterium]
MLEHPGQVFTKAQLYSQVWNEAVVNDNTITVYVKRIGTRSRMIQRSLSI